MSKAPLGVDGPPPVREPTRLLYGFGSVAFGVKDSGFNYFLLLFYNQVLGLPAATVGLAVMIALFADALLDPLIGQLSDGCRSRWGRRHPFMYASAAPVALSFLLLWNPPPLGTAGLTAWLIATAIVIRTCISLYEIPSAALVAELTADYDERTRLLSYRYLFGWLGGVGVAWLALQVLLKPDAAHAAGQLNRAGYSHYSFVAAGVMLVAILASAAGTHRRIPFLRRASMRRVGPGSLLRETAQAFAYAPFLRIQGGALFAAMAGGLILSSALYLNTYFWGLASGEIAAITGASVISAGVAFLLAPRLSQRFGKRASGVGVMLAAAAIACAPIGLRLAGLAPQNGDPSVFPLVLGAHVGATACAIAGSILISSMTADVVEHFELASGRRAEGVFFAGSAFVAKAVSGVGVFASGILLWAAGFPAGARPGLVPAEVLHRLGLTYLPAVAALYLASALCVASYRISRKSHGEALEALGAD